MKISASNIPAGNHLGQPPCPSPRPRPSALAAALGRAPGALGLEPGLGSLRPRFQLHCYETVESTNTQAWRLVDQGAGSGTVAIAARQTAGRGQWGRQWVSAPGGLYLSLVLELEPEQGDRPLLTLAAAWGIAAALHRLGLPIQIKWPNDLVYQGRKVGGILTETRTSPLGVTLAVVGVGLNWRNPVPPPGQRLGDLLGKYPVEGLDELEELAAIALRGIFQGYYCWQRWGGGELVRRYQCRLSHLGQSIPIPGHFGTVVGVSEQGYLLVQPHGVQPDAMSPDDGGAEGSVPSQGILRIYKPGEIQLGYA